MFWGLIMEPQKRYSQVIKKAFHISMASLDLSNSDGQPSQVMCGFEGRNYLLCTLQKPDQLQCPLDLYFEEGTTVSFATNGKSHVHLTGYLTKDVDEMELEEESEDEESQKFEVKAQKKSLSQDNGEDQPSKKKIKQSEQVEEEEDTDDSDVDLEKLMQDVEEQSEEESGGEEESGDEEESAEDEFSDEEDDEELEDDDDDDEEEDEEDSKPDIVVNGLGKKAKKERKELQESPKKGPQETPKKDKQGKDKPNLKQTPGPKAKQQENGRVEDQKSKEKKEKKNKDNQSQTPKKKTLPGGVVVEDLREGSGDAASNGKFVHVYYEGRLKSNNKVFDKTQNGPGFGFRLGKGEVIKGWDLGVSGMKVGGKRRITCPPHLAYGPKGSPPVIPPNSTLVFEVELKKIK